MRLKIKILPIAIFLLLTSKAGASCLDLLNQDPTLSAQARLEAVSLQIQSIPNEKAIPKRLLKEALNLLSRLGFYQPTDKKAALYFGQKANEDSAFTIKFADFVVATGPFDYTEENSRTLRFYTTASFHNAAAVKAFEIFGLRTFDMEKSGVIGIERKKGDPKIYYFTGTDRYKSESGRELLKPGSGVRWRSVTPPLSQ